MKKIAVTICLLLVAGGCQPQGLSEGDTGDTPQSKMAGRLDAALEIKEETARLNALIKVAEDSAKTGDGDVVLRAIAEIREGIARDNTCAICAEQLAKSGNTSAATKVAKQIKDETRRLNVLNGIVNADSD